MRVILIGVAVATALTLSACGKRPYGSANTAAVNVKKFCSDYIAAANNLQYNITDASTIKSLREAQAEAPAAIKSAVTKILNATIAVNESKKPTHVDLTAASTQVSNWGKTHC